MTIAFSKPRRTALEAQYIESVLTSGYSQGGGIHSKWCQDWINSEIGVPASLLTTSATDALEMAGLLLDLKQGDEVIMPSFTFSSTANSVALRGATPVFVDVDHATFNIKVDAIREAISSKTKAIYIVHYGGVACDMNAISRICSENNLFLVVLY